MAENPSPDAPQEGLLASTTIWTRRLIISFTWLTWLALAIFTIYLLSYIQVALWVLVIAALIAYAVVPLVNLARRVMPRFLAIILVYLIIVGILFLLVYLLINTIITQISALAASVRGYLTPGAHGKTSPLVQILQHLGLSQAQLNALSKNLEAQLGTMATNLANRLLPLLSGVLYFLTLILFTGVVSIYLIVDGGRFVHWISDNVPLYTRPGTRRFVQILRDVVGGYIRGEIILCIIIGLLVGLGMLALGVPYPAFLGAMATFLEFIPVIGVLTSGVLCCLLALTQGWILALIVLIYFIFIHIIEGYVLVPKIVGRAIGLNPAITLLAVIAANELFGLLGAVLAGPLAGLIQKILAAAWLYYRETHREQFRPAQQEQR